MSEEFNARDHDRPPREDGYAGETMLIMEHIENRGDQRIGQYLINAIRQQIDDVERPEPPSGGFENATEEEIEKYIEESKKATYRYQAKVENTLWSMEAPELLEAIEKMEEQHT